MSQNTDKCGFIIRPQHKYLQKVLTKEQLGQLWISIIEYLESGDMDSIKFDGDIDRLAFLGIKDQIDKDRDTYKKRCEINKRNGSKGGRPAKGAKDEF